MSSLRYWMKKQKLSERSLSSCSGLSRQTIRNVLDNNLSVSLENYKIVAKSLNKEIDLLIYDLEEKFDSTNTVLYLSSQEYSDELFSIKLDKLLDYIRLTKDERVVFFPPVYKHLTHQQTWELVYRMHSTCFALNMKIPLWLHSKFRASISMAPTADILMKIGKFCDNVEKLSFSKLIDEYLWDKRNILALNYLKAEWHYFRLDGFNSVEFDTEFYNIKIGEL